jgi:ubiquinone/menaquinone biosynthesis C-methylase UbiE
MKELIQGRISEGPLDVLDVGGGPGVYAAWLAELGHRVHVVDPISLHVEQARAAHGGVTAEVGDARRLTQADDSVDVVLLLGPLYHLADPDDRLAALREARRVLRPEGLLFAAAISRFAALLDLLLRADALHEPGVLTVVESALETGVFRGADAGLFTTAYFHRQRDLHAEVGEAGFAQCEVVHVEGPSAFVSDFEARWKDDDRRDAMMRVARLVENEPELLGAGSHLLAIARGP